MKFYKIKVRLGGSLTNEVWRLHVSAPEVLLLNAIHGGNGIAEFKETSETKFDLSAHRRLRARLVAEYGNKEAHKAHLANLFGTAQGGELPTQVTQADLDPISAQVDDLGDEPDVAPITPKPRISEDPKEAVKQSIRELGGKVPAGNASLETLREALAEAQEAAMRELQPNVLEA